MQNNLVRTTTSCLVALSNGGGEGGGEGMLMGSSVGPPACVCCQQGSDSYDYTVYSAKANNGEKDMEYT